MRKRCPAMTVVFCPPIKEKRKPCVCVPTQEAKYVESWPNTTSAWGGWSRFYIPVDSYGGVHSLLLCTAVHWGLLPATRLASRKIPTVLSKLSKSGQGQHSVYSVVPTLRTIFTMELVLRILPVSAQDSLQRSNVFLTFYRQ
jgi:hypothetical protein